MSRPRQLDFNTEWRRGRPFWYFNTDQVPARGGGAYRIMSLGLPLVHVQLSVYHRPAVLRDG